ncbi:MAG: diaminopimelate decarboxylase [Candidatus Anstonellaceae archaeon]
MLLNPLNLKGTTIYIENVPLRTIYLRFGPGPIYVYSQKKLEQNFELLSNAFRSNCFKTKVYYAIKANSNPQIIKILKKCGAGADCSNLNEIKLALYSGIKKEEILYSGNNNPFDDLLYAAKNNIAINFDWIDQFARLSNIANINLSKNLISFRYNPPKGIGENKKIITAGKNSKFGMDSQTLFSAYKLAKNRGIKRFGLHMMSGSNTLQIQPFLNQLTQQLKIAGELSKKFGIEFEFIDIGGGFGVKYSPNQKELDIKKLGKKICSLYTRLCNKYKVKASVGEFPTLILEPGRYLVANSSALISEITNIKNLKSKKIIGLYASMATLIRPAFYGSYHHIYIDKKLNGKKIKADFVGQACESSDYFARNRLISENVEVGDLAVICTAGAYGFSMSSNYCNMLKPAEVLVNKNKIKLIRKRENFYDLLN